MKRYTVVPNNPFFNVSDGLNRENQGDSKVAMLTEIDMSSANRLRTFVEAQSGVRPTYTALVAKAISLAMRRHPHANRIAVGPRPWRRIINLQDVDISVAVERDLPGLEQAVFVGTIRQTDNKDLAAISNELRELANATPETNARWRTFKWIVEKLPARLALWVVSLPRWSAKLWIEHRGGAALISSPAKYGVDIMVGAWPWPLGFSFGLIKERPFVEDGQVVTRPTMMLTMSFDRRLMGGAPAARFFDTICRFITNAETILMGKGDLIAVSDEYQGDIAAKRRTTQEPQNRSVPLSEPN